MFAYAAAGAGAPLEEEGGGLVGGLIRWVDRWMGEMEAYGKVAGVHSRELFWGGFQPAFGAEGCGVGEDGRVVVRYPCIYP